MKKCLLCNSYFKVEINFKDLFFTWSETKIPICSNCLSNFEKIKKPTCKWCNKAIDKTSSVVCTDCQSWEKIYPNNLLKNTALFRYNSSFHDLMVNYKRYGDYALREALSFLIKKLPQADYYVPLPTSPSHMQRRKFDTISSIFESKVSLTYLLAKDDSQKAQGEKNRSQRLATKQTFYVKENKQLTGNVLLLDDIYTTGRTLYHARDAIQEKYPKIKIQSFTIAR